MYLILVDMCQNYGVALVVLSIITSLLIRPFMALAAQSQRKEKRIQEILQPQLNNIKELYKGAERHRHIQRLYRRYAYHPVMSVRSAFGVALQIPFLMAAYYMLSDLADINGVSLWVIKDLSQSDKLIGGINILPFVMTTVNLLSAYTTHGFSSKDKIQAWGIALVFLVLLYTAPSALLIYWTCNNLWGLLHNLIGKHLELRWTKIEYTLNIHKISLQQKTMIYLSVAIAVTIGLFVPLDIYASNAKELWFDKVDVIFQGVKVALGMMFCMIGIGAIACKFKIISFYNALASAILMGVCIQSYVINYDYGRLDGNRIAWDQLQNIALYNSAAWLIIFALVVWLFKRYRIFEREKIICTMSLLLIGVQFISVSYIMGRDKSKKETQYFFADKGKLEMSAHDNVVVLILDAFDLSYLGEIQKNEPQLIEGLEGFTLYENATSVYGGTFYSIPQMLTGAEYVNEGDFASYIHSAWQKTNNYKLFQENGYDIEIYDIPQVADNNTPARNVLSGIDGIGNNTWKSFYEIVLFRSMPHVLKHNFVVYSGELQKNDTVSENKMFSESNWLFYQDLKSKGITTNRQNNCFKWYHIDGAHLPVTMTKDMEPVENPNDLPLYDQISSSFKIGMELIRQMKEKDIFDDATIVILADHGKHNAIGVSPIMLVKQPKALKQPLQVDKEPFGYDSLFEILNHRFTMDKKIRLNHDRHYYKLGAWTENSWPLTKYKVPMQANKEEEWQIAEEIAARSEKTGLYQLNDKMWLTMDGYAKGFSTSNWKERHFDGAWVGESGDIYLTLSHIPNKPVIFEADLVSAHTDQSSVVDIIVNEKKVAEWSVHGHKICRTIIPTDVLNNKDVDIRFNVHNPRKMENVYKGTTVVDGVKMKYCGLFDMKEYYSEGTLLRFTNDDSESLNYLMSGWNDPERDGIWTEGHDAKLLFLVNDIESGNIHLTVKAAPWLSHGMEKQDVDVIANGRKLGTWEVRAESEYEVDIPASVLEEKALELSFHVSNPVRVSEEDSRQIGFRLTSLKMDYQREGVLYSIQRALLWLKMKVGIAA